MYTVNFLKKIISFESGIYPQAKAAPFGLSLPTESIAAFGFIALF